MGFSQVRTGDLMLWYAVGALLVFAVPSYVWFRAEPWRMPPSDEIQAWYWMVAFLVAAVGVTVVRASRGALSLPLFAMLATGPWVLAYVALMPRLGVAHSRGVALVAAVVGTGMLIAPAAIPRIAMPYVARIAALMILLAGAMSGPGPVEEVAAAPEVERQTVVSTSLVPLTVTYESGLITDTLVPGGAIARLGRDLLLVTGEGGWYEVGWDSTGLKLRTRKLDIPAPMSRPEYDPHGPGTPFIRVTGLVISQTPGSVTAYVAHEVWRSEEGCVHLQVSAMRLKGWEAAETTWRPIYVTQPCIQPGEGFDSFETGGRLLLQSDGSLLLTVGDYGLNREASSAHSQRPSTDYGKTLRIGVDGSRALNTLGHRNPGGLTSDRNGNVWVAEHGPQGGDELNLLQAGGNYGWPLVTYGTDYGSYRWRYPSRAPSAAFREPSLVFVPSVAISSLIAVQGSQFEQWAGDLLAGSLRAERLLRIRLTGTRPLYAEPIQVNRRIRDLVEAENGRIVLWTDEGDLVWLSTANNVMLGAFAYEKCSRCHGGVTRVASRLAPALAGVAGRRVASLPDFPYTDALKQVRGVWTDERLDAFLRSPSTFAPGNAMQFAGIADSVERRVLLDFIRASLRSEVIR